LCFGIASKKKSFFIIRVDSNQEPLDPKRLEAIRTLLDDSSVMVRNSLLAFFSKHKNEASTFLKSALASQDKKTIENIRWYLNELKFSDPEGEFRTFIRSLNYELETGAFLLSRTVSPKLDVGECCELIDAIAFRCKELIAEPSTVRDQCRIINRVLFHDWGFRGNIEHYNDPRNSLIDQVLKRRKGLPLTLCIIYLLVAERLEITLEPVALPGHFLVGYYNEKEPFFIDPFEQGLFRDSEEVFDLLRSRKIVPQVSDLAPSSIREVLSRNCRNLHNHYLQSGEEVKAKLFASFVEEFDAAYARNME
jgi:regulator of sirC expression with transglutaminase-like and TPR domain